ncbi:MAG: hypothetical protein JWN78_775 [Bacteroidota bacterium]|nr:hypothetical protein [Bacteroidota bacterium]
MSLPEVNSTFKDVETVAHIQILQPPSQLLSGFLDFAKEVAQKSKAIERKFSEEELVELFNNSFPGKIRANFFLWVMDLNKVIEAINIILSDLLELRKDKNSLSGNPVIRSEFLLQAFFGEFFKIREIAKVFFKYLTKEGILNNKYKEDFVGFYFTAFNWVYDLRNNIIHQGVHINDFELKLDFGFLNNLSKEERLKFITLINESNTRENTVEIQCAIYMKIILGIMKNYLEFQEFLNNVLADLIIDFEKMHLEITVSRNE